MDNNIIETDFEKLLEFRASKNLPIFGSDYNTTDAKLYIQAENSIVLSCIVSKNNSKFKSILKYLNKPIRMDSLMLESHNFGDSTSWSSTDNSLFVFKPYDGYKLIVTSIVARMPIDVNLEVNPITFKVYLSLDGVTPVDENTPPCIIETYRSIKDLVNISNSTLVVIDEVTNLSNTKMLEIKFRYADSDLSNSSKLTLNSSLNERVDVMLENNTPVLDSNGNALEEACYSIFNTKRVYDF